jgi:hypothetical protein
MPLSCEIWENFGTLVFELGFCVPHRQNKTPYQILPHVITLAFDSKLNIKLLQPLHWVAILSHESS